MIRTATLAALAILAGPATAQLPFRYQTDSPNNDPAYGVACTGIGDVDGDGHADFAITETSTGPFQPPGFVFVHSGATGDLLYSLSGKSNADGYGLALAGVGDVNGDGVPDLVVGAREDDTNATGCGRVEVVSGDDGTLIHELVGLEFIDHLGDTVCGMGDVDGDGLADFAVSQQGDGLVRIHSGADLAVLATFVKPVVPGAVVTFPDSIANAGDVDGDGMNDLVAGARGISPQNMGAVWLFSSATGQILLWVTGDDVQEHLGASVAGGVDLDGDGVPDFLGGAPSDLVGGEPLGSVTLFSGATGQLIAKHEGLDQPPARFGEQVEFVGDVNGDGVTDYAGVSRYTGTVGASGYVQIFSGVDHHLLDEFQTSAPFDHFGSCFAALGDTEGDGLPEFLVGAKGARVAHVMCVAGTLRYGELPEAAQSLAIGWVSEGLPDPAVGRVRASGAPPHAAGFLLLSPGPDALLFQGTTTILVDLSQPGELIYGASFDASGATQTPPGSLRSAAIDGLSYFAQFVAIDPGAPAGFATTPGLEMRFTD